jgi:Mg2+ and Co2+ transporter CorA
MSSMNARRSQISYDASMALLKESKLGIELSKSSLRQNQSVKRLTQLAFISMPLSCLTSIFRMNIDVLTGDRAKWWAVLVGAEMTYFDVFVGLLGLMLD